MELGHAMNATILVVDDRPDNLALISRLLKDTYRLEVANDGEKALKIARESRPDLILLDIRMPGKSGYDVCRELKSDPSTSEIPIIFLTASTDDEQHGFEMGAVDYITKPFKGTVVLARVATHLKIKAASDFLKDKNAYLEQEVLRRTSEMIGIQDMTILVIASLAEGREAEASNHLRRTQAYVKVLAQQLTVHPRFREFLSDGTIDLLFRAAPLHDIGKGGIPDRILLKPGKLRPDEFEIMKMHTTLGREAIEHAWPRLGMDIPFLDLARDMAYGHQERWDGTGYPEGKSGDDIPIAARLMAVADVYDALTSHRPYRKALSTEMAKGLLIEGRGSLFDPDMVDVFLAIEDEIASIRERFPDSRAAEAKMSAMADLFTGG
jgi:putative two-component system response regulator